MTIEQSSIRISDIGTISGINTDDGQEYYQAINAHTYTKIGGNFESICGFMQGAGVRLLLDVAYDSSGNPIPNSTAAWFRTSDTNGEGRSSTNG